MGTTVAIGSISFSHLFVRERNRKWEGDSGQLNNDLNPIKGKHKKNDGKGSTNNNDNREGPSNDLPGDEHARRRVHKCGGARDIQPRAHVEFIFLFSHFTWRAERSPRNETKGIENGPSIDRIDQPSSSLMFAKQTPMMHPDIGRL
jgi:hypothetical protein